MARIYTIEEIKVSSKNHTIFRISFHPNSIPNYRDLIDWALRQPRSRPFIKDTDFLCTITSHYEGHVVVQGMAYDGNPHLKHYDVQVYNEKQAAYFRKCWKIDPEEYKRNLSYEIELDNRRGGHILIDGKPYGISELMPKPKDKTPVAPRMVWNKNMEKLKKYLTTMSPKRDKVEKGKYWFVPDCIFDDFNKEISEGQFGIRADDGFWVVAILPMEFSKMPIEELVAVLWPAKFETATFHGDADDTEYWAKYHAPVLKRMEKEIQKRRARKSVREGSKLAKELSDKGSIQIKLKKKKR